MIYELKMQCFSVNHILCCSLKGNIATTLDVGLNRNVAHEYFGVSLYLILHNEWHQIHASFAVHGCVNTWNVSRPHFV